LRRIGWVLGALVVSGCVVPAGPVPVAPVAVADSGPRGAAQQAAANFIAAVDRVEPVAEATCRARTSGIPCDFRIVVDDRPDQPPNAFQTLDRFGQPVLGFTLALIADARNVDEIAFVMGHEASHHILGHIPATEQSAAAGAVLAGVLASLGGGDAAAIEAAQTLGATVGARRFSKEFELEADALGTEIAFRAGFDPVRGAAFFTRLPDPGDRFLGSHPPNAARIATVRAVAAQLR
jgi:predicted Zn-dependent protease